MPVRPLVAAACVLSANGLASAGGLVQADLPNRSFEHGDDRPSQWKVWNQSGAFTLTRDTYDYHSWPASLKVESLSEFSSGTVYVPTRHLEPGMWISGMIKCDGDWSELQVAVQTMNDEHKGTGWYECYMLTGQREPIREWRFFAGRINLPNTDEPTQVALLAKGRGRVWFDSLDITRERPEPPISDTVALFASDRPSVAPRVSVDPVPSPDDPEPE